MYEKVYAGSNITQRNFIRAYGKVIAINSFFSTGAEQTQYLHRDHLGSVDTVTKEDGGIAERFSFDAFGKRRKLDWYFDTDSSELYDAVHVTPRGYTGHEHLDAVGLIHMNGRVYDPIFGRFLSADPFVQFPESTQGLNRYSYVHNNPLSYTDPSGFSIEAILAAIALIIVGEATDTPVLTQIGFALICQTCTAGQAFAAGFAGGLISSDGDIRTAVVSGATAGAFNVAGAGFEGKGILGSTLESSGYVSKVVIHGTIGGVSSDLQGGSFKSGFLSAGFAQAASPGIERYLGQLGTPGAPARVIAAAVIGGTASELGGGKFANGAVTGAFSRAFNDEHGGRDPRTGAMKAGEALRGGSVRGM
ncbi:MAG: RHS repeat-associated core domain-containing protein, partial [Nevskiales bacterium]